MHMLIRWKYNHSDEHTYPESREIDNGICMRNSQIELLACGTELSGHFGPSKKDAEEMKPVSCSS